MNLRQLAAALAAFTASSALAAPLTVNASNSPFTVTTSVNDTWDSVTVETGGVLVLNGEIHTTTGDFVVRSGGTVRSSLGIALVTIDTGTRLLDVQFGGAIDLTGQGLLGGGQAGNGYGATGQSFDPNTFLLAPGSGQYAGGNHIARGGGSGAQPYANQLSPPMRGGGGGSGCCNVPGGNGGGALRITAGTLRVDGNILVNGAVTTGGSAGGGAGGSIQAIVTTLSGAGAITTSGGAGSGGGGSGGRINISLTTNSFSGSISSYGGSGNPIGGTGSVYIRSAANVQYVRGGTTDFSSSDSAERVVFGPGGVLRLYGPAAVTMPIVVPTGSTLELNAGTALSASTLATPVDGTLVVNTAFARTGDLTVNGTLQANAQLTVTGDLTLGPGSTLTHLPQNRNAYLSVSGQLDIQGTATFVGRGCPGETRWDTVTRACVSGVPQYTGGSHGGRGGNAPSTAYGNQDVPIDPGSGGGAGCCNIGGGAGGGILRIQAGTLVLDGIIDADGASSVSGSAGGGSGGSIRIDATTVTGGGVIRAEGGDGQGGGGAGGRISVNYTNWMFTGLVTARGGSGGPAGGEGSVRLRSAATALTVVNGRYDLGAGHTYSSVTLAGNALLAINGPASVTSQITIPASNRVQLNATDALMGITLSNTIQGALELNTPFTLGPQTVPGTLVVNASSTLGDLTVPGTLEVNATLTVPNITLPNGGVMTHAAGDSDMVVNASGTVSVGPMARIDLDGKGLAPNTSIDPISLMPFSFGEQYTGGSHGGLGGNGRPVYGLADAPIHLGGGAGAGCCNISGGRGGGRMRLSASTLRVDGTVSARGASVLSGSAGGGAGGSIWLSVGTFSGVGHVFAHGGDGQGGGGGGGRISIDYTTRTHTGLIGAAGGSGSPAGQPGTVRLQNAMGATDLVVSNGVYRITGGQTYNSVTLQPGALLHIDGPVTITQPFAVPAGATVWLNASDAATNLALPTRIDGTLVLNAPFPNLTLPRQVAGVLWTRQNVTMPQSLELLQGGTLRNDATVSVTGDVVMTSGATITHSNQVKTFDLRITGRLHVPAGAAVNMDGVGYWGGNNSGFGCNGATFDPATMNVRAGSGQYVGGSFGGLGGGTNPNPVYGAATSVQFMGSGGGCGCCNIAGGNGGGLVRISASVIELFGHIRANGGASTSGSAGGGSGGGIHLVAAALLGNGLIRANGGAGQGGGGGGGRILLEIANNGFTGTVEALGGSPGGAVGSISQPMTMAAPVIVSTPSPFAKVNAPWSYDADGLPQAAGTQPLTWSLVSGPPSATVNASTGAFTWTPTSLGRVSFVLRVSNAQGSSDQMFNVDVLAPPAVVSTAAGTAQVGLPYHYNGSDTVMVTGSQPLTFTATVAPPGAPSFSVDPTGKVTWTPSAQGTFSPCIRVENAVGNTDHCFTVTVSGTVTPPDITSTPPATAAIGMPYAYQLLANGSAPITFEFLPGASPMGASLGMTSGQLSWTPMSVGTSFFCVRASNAGGSDTQCWDVMVLSMPASAVITSACERLAKVGEPYHYDADDTVNVSGSSPITLTLQMPPAGMTMTPGGLISWTPTQAGPFSYAVKAENGSGSFTQTCSGTVRPAAANMGPPVILRTANAVAAVGLLYFYDVGGRMRADGLTPISWSKVSGPQAFAVDSVTGVVTWRPTTAGMESITVRASNSAGEDTYTFTVDVRAMAPPPPSAGIVGGTTIGGPAPFDADFDGRSSTTSSRIVSWSWDYGDGSPPGQGPVSEHTYASCGGYVARLTVTDEYGQTSVAEQLVQVSCGGLKPPIARILMAQRTATGSLNGTFAADITQGSGPIQGQQWLSTDGFSSDLAADMHVFGPGGHTLQLIVVDTNGLTAIDRVTITVTDPSGNMPPQVTAFATPASATAPAQVTFSSSALDTDGTIASFGWRFADGASSADPSPVRSYEQPLTERAVFTATDDKGLSASAIAEAQVTSATGGAPPEVISRPRVSVFLGVPYTYDKDGVPSVRGRAPFMFTLPTAPAGATVDGATGAITWTPDAPGMFDFVLEVSDSGGKAQQAWKVEVVGTAVQPKGGCSCDAGGGALMLLAALALSLRRRRSPPRAVRG